MWTSEAVAVKMKMVNGSSKRNDLSRFSPPEEGDRLNFFFLGKKSSYRYHCLGPLKSEFYSVELLKLFKAIHVGTSF